MRHAEMEARWKAQGLTGVRFCHNCGKHLGGNGGAKQKITWVTMANPIGQTVRVHHACVDELKPEYSVVVETAP